MGKLKLNQNILPYLHVLADTDPSGKVTSSKATAVLQLESSHDSQEMLVLDLKTNKKIKVRKNRRSEAKKSSLLRLFQTWIDGSRSIAPPIRMSWLTTDEEPLQAIEVIQKLLDHNILLSDEPTKKKVTRVTNKIKEEPVKKATPIKKKIQDVDILPHFIPEQPIKLTILKIKLN